MKQTHTKLEKLVPEVIRLLEFDAASYGLSARFARTKSSERSFRTREQERRKMIAKLQQAKGAIRE